MPWRYPLAIVMGVAGVIEIEIGQWLNRFIVRGHSNSNRRSEPDRECGAGRESEARGEVDSSETVSESERGRERERGNMSGSARGSRAVIVIACRD